MTCKKGMDMITRWLKQAEAEGWCIKMRRRTGHWMVYPPNGTQGFLVHRTYGSDKAMKNVEKLFQRGGLKTR